MPKAQMAKWGNSLVVRIPKNVADAARLQECDALTIEVADGRIALHRADAVPSLAELVAQITPSNRYDETKSGPERGLEKVEW